MESVVPHLQPGKISLFSFRHACWFWLSFITSAIPRHQNKKREIHHCKYLCQQGIERCRSLRSQPSQYKKTDHKKCKRYFKVWTFVADRLDRATIQPWQKTENSHSGSHQNHSPQLCINP